MSPLDTIARERQGGGSAPNFRTLLAQRPHLTLTAVGLAVEAVPLIRIAVGHGTPTWVYSAGAISHRYRMMATALSATGLDV